MDISKIEDSALPEDEQRRVEAQKEEDEWCEQASKSMVNISSQMRASVEKQVQLDRIERKLDQVLEILNRPR